MITVKRPQDVPKYDFKNCPHCNKKSALLKDKSGKAVCPYEDCKKEFDWGPPFLS